MASDPPQRKINLDHVAIAAFDKKIHRASFSCGNQEIDNFLKHTAEPQHHKSHCRVYYATLEDELIGFYSLAAASREAQTISVDAAKRFALILTAPCIYLGMLGVRLDCQGQGVGNALMVHAMETTLKVSALVGIYALILQAVDAEVGKRYKKWGFDYFLGEEAKAEPHMFMALGTIKKACEQNRKNQNKANAKAGKPA